MRAACGLAMQILFSVGGQHRPSAHRRMDAAANRSESQSLNVACLLSVLSALLACNRPYKTYKDYVTHCLRARMTKYEYGTYV